jgi:hypothetical protein
LVEVQEGADVMPLELIIEKEELEAAKEPAEFDSLPVFFDLLSSSVTIRRRELHRVGVHAQNRTSRQLTKKNTHLQLLLGQKDEAIAQLLETPHTDPRFYQDALKACVVAASHSAHSFETTISHIASHMISQGNVDEVRGVAHVLRHWLQCRPALATLSLLTQMPRCMG